MLAFHAHLVPAQLADMTALEIVDHCLYVVETLKE